MKLLKKISVLYIFNTLLVFAAGMFAVYFAVNLTISSQIDEQLKDQSKAVVDKLKNGITVANPPLIEIFQAPAEAEFKPVFKDTSFLFGSEQEFIDYREYKSVGEVNGKKYIIITRSSLIEKDDLFISIFGATALTIAVLLLILFYINRRSAEKILIPFRKNLEALEGFSIQDNKELKLEKSNIEEFDALNKSLILLSEKAVKEYNSLKEFTEDLSHELQTPVAVIKSKLELALQKEDGEKETLELIKTAYQNTIRLDKLNRALVLLAKLEAKELFRSSSISISEKLLQKSAEFEEIASLKNIKINSVIEPGVMLEANDNLLDIMLNNLLSNAVKHNYENGNISVKLKNGIITIENSGKEPSRDPETFFERFAYENKSENSLGLGLAIVKKICLLYGYTISYTYSGHNHTFTIDLKVRS